MLSSNRALHAQRLDNTAFTLPPTSLRSAESSKNRADRGFTDSATFQWLARPSNLWPARQQVFHRRVWFRQAWSPAQREQTDRRPAEWWASLPGVERKDRSRAELSVQWRGALSEPARTDQPEEQSARQVLAAAVRMDRPEV
jgi:hypothetical protein